MYHGWRCCWIIEPRCGHIVTCTAPLTFTCPAVPCNCTKCPLLAMHVKSPATRQRARVRPACGKMRARAKMDMRWTVSIPPTHPCEASSSEASRQSARTDVCRRVTGLSVFLSTSKMDGCLCASRWIRFMSRCKFDSTDMSSLRVTLISFESGLHHGYLLSAVAFLARLTLRCHLP